MIPRLNAERLAALEFDALQELAHTAKDVGFFTVYNTSIPAAQVEAVLRAYRDFFHLPDVTKQSVDMARTGANRGWGASGSEQVDPNANPDYKQFFDVGLELSPGDPMVARDLAVYAPNQWPEDLPLFRREVQRYFAAAMQVAMQILRAIAKALGHPADWFDDKFRRPMALLRGNYYPQRPDWAGARDFGIATHTDYGCLTLLATDGAPGLEVRRKGGGWIPVSAPPGEFVINFGEMLESWSGKQVRATPHRVVGTLQERISIPLFFNPSYDTNVAPPASPEVLSAGEHLSRRFQETYVHLQKS